MELCSSKRCSTIRRDGFLTTKLSKGRGTLWCSRAELKEEKRKGMSLKSKFFSWKERSRLSKAQTRSKLLDKLARLLERRYIFVLLSIAYLAVLGYDGLFMDIYVDEKGLLPYGASTYFNSFNAGDAKSKARRLRDDASQTVYRSLNGWRASTLLNLEELGYEPVTLSFPQKNNLRIEHVTVAAVNRAPGTDGTEALLLTASWQCPFHTEKDLALGRGKNVNGFALLQAFAAYARYKNFWARDLIFLFSATPPDLDDWMLAYTGKTDRPEHVERASSLFSGQIQQVVNIDLCPDSNLPEGDVDLRSDGLYGQLSNLDIVSTASVISRHWKFFAREFGVGALPPRYASDAVERYMWHTRQLWTTVKRQALGKVTTEGVQRYGHEFFPQYGIDSITVRRVTSGDLDEQSMRQIALVYEHTLRSLNNLLEYLHHSLSFYLTSEARRFVPFSVYIGTVAALLLPLVLTAFAALKVSKVSPKNTQLELVDLPDDDSSKAVALGAQAARERETELNKKTLLFSPECSTLATVIFFHAIGFVLYAHPIRYVAATLAFALVASYLFKSTSHDGEKFVVFRYVASQADSFKFYRAEFCLDGLSSTLFGRRIKALNLLLASSATLPLSLLNYSLALLVIVSMSVVYFLTFIIAKFRRGRLLLLALVPILAYAVYKPDLVQLALRLVLCLDPAYNYKLETFDFVTWFFVNSLVIHIFAITL